MISSNENLGDRPVRRHINKIAFIALAFTALVILLAVWFFAAKRPGVDSRPSASKQERLQSNQ